MSRYKAILILGAVSVAMSATFAIIATATVDPVTRFGRVRFQAVHWLAEPVTTHEMSTTPTEFFPTPLSIFMCRPFGAASADVSLQISGGAIEARVVEYDSDGSVAYVLRPASVSMRPPTDDETQSFSFTFIKPFFRSLNQRGWNVEWRSVTRDEVTLHEGTLRALYGRKPGDKGGCE